MASTAQQINSNQSPQTNSCAKRKKSKGSKGSYLSKWLDKTLHHDSGSFPSLDADMYVNPNVNWHTGNSQFGPGYDNYRQDMYGCMAGHNMSLPTFLNQYNPVIPPSDYRCVQSENKSVQVQRPRVRKTNRSKAEEISSAPIDSINHSHYFQPKTMSDSQDYTSLPPIITSTGDTNSVSDVHTNERDEGNNGRRFSDPVVRGLPDVARPANGEVESDSDSDSDLSGSQVGGRLLAYLLDQISSLKTANERINKELLETKAELETARHQAFYTQAPNNFSSNGVLGGQYSPGFLTDLVREIRDAARIREEAMYARVRAMVHERQDSGIVSAESKISDRTLEEIKCSLRASETDRRRMMDRIGKLEDELRTLRLTNGQEHTENRVTNGNDESAECERLRLRKELAEMRKAKQSAEDNAHKLERLVTQMRSKFNGTQQNGPDSLPSDADEPVRIRRISSSTNNSTGNLTNALNNSTNILNSSTNVLNSSNNLHNSSTNVLNSSNNLHNSSTNVLNSSTNLHNLSTNLLNSSNNLHNSSTNILNSSSNLHNSSTNLLNSSHNTNNSSFGHLTNASPMVFGLVTDL